MTPAAEFRALSELLSGQTPLDQATADDEPPRLRPSTLPLARR